MRITSEVMVTRSLDRLQTRLKAYERTQSELGTGRRIIQPSDDPAGARRAMTLRASMASQQRNLANASDGIGLLDAADSQLQAASNRLARIRELTTAGASASSTSEREAIAQEVGQITDELVGIANARHRDRPLFGGFTDEPAVIFDGGTWDTNGDGEEIKRRVSDSELVRINVTAEDWLGPDADLLNQLGALVNDLRTGTPADVGAHLDDLTTAQNRIGGSLASIGAATNRVESARERAESQLLTVRTELSNVQDVDIAGGVMELQVQQVAYEATLQALSKALPPSLVSFLR